MGPFVSRATARPLCEVASECMRTARLSGCLPNGMVYEGFGMQVTNRAFHSLARASHIIPHLPLQGFIYHSLFQRAVDPAAWGHIRWTAALDPCVWNAQTGLARQCRPELCSGETRVYHHVESQLPALCGKSAAAAEPLDGARRQRPSPRSAAHVSSGGCAATPGCCARHPGACRTKEA